MDEPEKNLRLFVALSIPAAAARQLQDLPRKGIDANWTPSGDLHITLRFLGEVVESRLPEITEALERVRRPAFHVEMQGLGAFDGGRQSVLFAAVQSTRKLIALAGDINEVLARLGFEMPRKPFMPHVTLARLKDRRGLDAYVGRHGKQLQTSWQAASFGLYLSADPDENRRRYTQLAEFPLRP